MSLGIDVWVEFGGFRKALMRYFRCRFVGGGAPSWAQNPDRSVPKAEEARRRRGGERESNGPIPKAHEIPRRP